MAEVIRSGKDRIQGNDGTVGLNINDSKISVNDDDSQFMSIASDGLKVSDTSGEFITMDSAGLTQQDTTDTNRMQIGRDVKLSQPSVDVTDAQSVDTIFTSEQLNGFKIIATGTVATSALGAAGGSSTGSTTSVNLGNISNGTPTAHIAYIDNGSFYQPLPYYRLQYFGASASHPSGSFGPYRVVTSYTSITGSDLFINVFAGNADTGGGMPSYTVRYYILLETATT